MNNRSRIKRQSILGLPVIDGSTGKRLGVVKDLYVNGQSAKLDGFYVTDKGWGNKTIGIPFDDVTIGNDAIIAEGNLSAVSRHSELNRGELEKLLGKKVVREDGLELGYISDIILDPLTGRIDGLELSESVIGDLMSGRRILPYEPHEYTNGDILVISMEQAERIISSNRGIKNIFFSKLE
ncbi:MAG TPA: hypothetical protein GX505_06335 [Clostridiales bacterium]|nr:hypothetical protein [Clostridiales bacterium]